MKKTIEKDTGKFIISYFENQNNIFELQSDNIIPLKIEFLSKTPMNEDMCVKYLNSHLIELIDEAKSIMKENKDFYQYYDIKFQNFTTFTYVRNIKFKEKIAVDYSAMNIEYNFKEINL